MIPWTENHTYLPILKTTHKRLKQHLRKYGDTMDSVIVKLLDAYEIKEKK